MTGKNFDCIEEALAYQLGILNAIFEYFGWDIPCAHTKAAYEEVVKRQEQQPRARKSQNTHK